MPGRTVYLGDNPNDFAWTIPPGSGHQFETLIEICLKRHVATQDASVTFRRTKISGDGGRDFEISFRDRVTLFGMTIQARIANAPDLLFIECKTTENDRLDDGFLADASQHDDGRACAYVLLTNAVVTPYCQYRAQQEWGRHGMIFGLVDRRTLADWLHRYDMAADASRLQIALPSATFMPSFSVDRLITACQTEYRNDKGAQTATVFVSIKNSGDANVLSHLHLATDLQWCARQQQYERIIMPGMIESFQLIADRQDLSGTSEISLSLSVNGRSQRLTATGTGVGILLEPPFIGSSHLSIRQDIRKIVEAANGFELLSIQGEAGVGKSRTINEALEPLTNGTYSRFIYYLSRQGLPAFHDYYELAGGNGPDHHVSDVMRLSELLFSAASLEVPVILQFEDLHHADEDILATFKDLVVHPPITKAPIIVVLTGRDDHTFPNEGYYSLLQLVSASTRKYIHSYAVSHLTDEDARNLVLAVVTNMPEPGLARVHSLGQNNPFIIIEILQYLLDAQLAQLLSRRTIGILNPEVFAGKRGLPETVEELYRRRLASLSGALGGDLAFKFLIAASFFGFSIDGEMRRTFFDGEGDGEIAWNLLHERRFVQEDTTTGEAAFAHENLLHYLRRLCRDRAYAPTASALLLNRPGLCNRLAPLDLGEVYYLHGDYATALLFFASMRKDISAVTNFSSEEIPRSYFAYLPALFHAGQAQNEPVELLVKVALAYGYMGVHNFPLAIAEDACKMASDFLQKLYPSAREGLREKLAIDQLRAHALQNMGRTGLALRRMLEIEGRLRDSGGDWPEVAFDLYDRLEEYYRKANHKELVKFYDGRAHACVVQTCDDKLLASHLITHSLVSLYGGYKEAARRAAIAHKAARTVGIHRLITYTRLTELIVEALYSGGNPSKLTDIVAEARSMLQFAIMQSFADSIMRIELLLGTLALSGNVDEDECRIRARSYVSSGQANSVRYGNGLFDWAFDNLAAVIDRRDPRRTDEDVRQRFRTCLERLHHRGLTFIGAESGTYPNAFAVSNIVRFFGGYQESIGVALVQQTLSTYDNRFTADDRIAIDIVRQAVRGQPIFWPRTSRLKMLRYPADSNGYFTPIF